MVRIVQHGGVVVRVPVQIVVVHRSLEVVAVEACHGRGSCRVLVMLDRQAGRRSRHQILKA